MKFIIVSDIHGRYERLSAVMEMHRNADALIFLGDGLYDLARADAYGYPFTVYSVRGNCDSFSLFYTVSGNAPTELLLRLGGRAIFATHGHGYSVKSGTDGAIAAAHQRGADILLYGHTHVPEERYLPSGSEIGSCVLQRPMWIFNPGSLGASRDGGAHFGILQISGSNILLSHGEL